MADPAKSIIPEGSVKIANRDVEYSTLFALGAGVLIGMILKS